VGATLRPDRVTFGSQAWRASADDCEVVGSIGVPDGCTVAGLCRLGRRSRSDLKTLPRSQLARSRIAPRGGANLNLGGRKPGSFMTLQLFVAFRCPVLHRRFQGDSRADTVSHIHILPKDDTKPRRPMTVQQPEPIVIKRYSRSRLYDPVNLRYVTVSQLREWAAEGVPFIVQDTETSADITQVLIT
jgi:PHB/PHA accumulation regulator DNA-binding domain